MPKIPPLPLSGIEVEVMPGGTILLESADPTQCKDPRLAMAVLALGQHMQVISSLDQLLSSALHVIAMQQQRIELLESRSFTELPPYEHADFVSGRVRHIQASTEAMRNAEMEARAKMERMQREAAEADERFDRGRRGEA